MGKNFKIDLLLVILVLQLFSCSKDDSIIEEILPKNEPSNSIDYSEIPQSDIYEVSIISDNDKEKVIVFQSSCPEFQLGNMNMIDVDQYPLEFFYGRTISWTNFSFSGSITVEIKVLDGSKVPVSGPVKVWPSRYGVTPTVNGNIVTFTLSNPGQFSIEIGENGYKNGLLIFADPKVTDVPDKSTGSYKIFNDSSGANLSSVNSSFSGIYFEKGVYDIGVYHIPSNIKNIYFEEGSWVYGALIMDNNSNVRIFGRGVLSGAKLNYRESHSVEAINQSNNIQIEGIVIADPKHFAVRLIGQDNTVKWTKVIGGWVYNTDGIAAFYGSSVSNCFIWANDDAIKVYRDNTTWSDCVVWQLNNGGVIQMGWTSPNSSNVSISRIDVLRAEWNKPGFNRALLNYVGNRYKEPGKSGYHSNWLIEDVVTETPIPNIFDISPDDFSTNPIHGLTLKNWNVKMTMNTEYQNRIIGNNPNEPFDGFVFDNVIFNGTKLDETNWEAVTEMQHENLIKPEFK